jgi:hypothetical protein
MCQDFCAQHKYSEVYNKMERSQWYNYPSRCSISKAETSNLEYGSVM